MCIFDNPEKGTGYGQLIATFYHLFGDIGGCFLSCMSIII